MFDIIFKKLPYPIASALVRGLRSFITIVISGVLAYVATGGLSKDVTIVAPNMAVFVVMIVSPLLLGLDKWLREHGLEDQVTDLPTTTVGTGPDVQP